jgi:branched-chain amino acid aminotransferase
VISLVETIKVKNYKIPLWKYHWERINDSFKKLNIKIPLIEEDLLKEISENVLFENSRLRIIIPADDGVGVNEIKFDCTAFKDEDLGKTAGINVDFYLKERYKYQYNLLNLKLSTYPVIDDARMFTHDLNLQEAIITNECDEIVEGTISNIFIFKEGEFFTPPLSSGCVDGVMRRFILDHRVDLELKIVEKEISANELLQAEEIYFTNALRGIRCVKNLGNKEFKMNEYAVLLSKIRALLNVEQYLSLKTYGKHFS